MPNIVIFGETMVELSKADAHLYKKGFAGDVHSVALYLKRAVTDQDTKCYLLSSCGADKLGDELVSTLNEQSISAELMLRHPSKTLGLYMVNTDANGERSFDYWRSTAAAKETLELLEAEGNEKLLDMKPDVFFFSGITLAILPEASRKKLWPLLKALGEQGCDVMFDPNYRPRLWSSADEARTNFEQAFALSTTLLPSLEDLEQLYNAEGFEHGASILEKFNASAKLVVKDGPNGILYKDQTESFHLNVKGVENVVDTTAAGDSFNGSYLAAGIQGKTPKEALGFAAKVAAEVIQHRGAVIPLNAYNKIAQS